jgi:hypothetical protein
MTEPDRRAMEIDLAGASFLSGVASSWWGHVEEPVPEWPHMLFWVAAAKRDKGPARFYLKLDCKGYPAVSPTGTLWDPETKQLLAATKWPKGTGQVHAVFQSAWENGSALYHPLDRVSMGKHLTATNDWRVKYPGHVWKGDRNVTRYLTMVHRLLNSSEYTGD